MGVIGHFIKLIRFQNLLLIAITQYALRYGIIKPLIESRKIELDLNESEPVIFDLTLTISNLDFFILVLSTVLIAAAGYVINDYFDLKLDKINKPEKIIVGTHIKRRVAMGAHIVMNSIGFLLGFYVAYKVGNWNLALIQVFAIISLWYYSTNFKYSLLGGNVIISLLAALIPLMIGLYEIPPLNVYMQDLSAQIGQVYNASYNFNKEAFWTIGFAVFAFIITMAREITKDIADIKGDEMYGAETLPIQWGVKTAKGFIIGLYLIALAGLFYAPQILKVLHNQISYVYLWGFLCLPIAFNIFLILKASTKTDYIRSSSVNKIISAIGILFPVAYYFTFFG